MANIEKARAALAAKHPKLAAEIMEGKWDHTPAVKREIAGLWLADEKAKAEAAAADPFEWCLTDQRQLDADNLQILRDEEDEPNFSAIIKRAQARLEDKRGLPSDSEIIRDLLTVIQHYDNELHSYFWNMSDNDQLPEGA